MTATTTSTRTSTPTSTARPAVAPAATRTPDRKIFFGTTAVLLTMTAVGLAMGLGGGTADAPTTGTTSHVTPDHILQPR
ncbi:MAG TPA: hypothetical protein VGE11_14900 [Pseudonocardia sp.]